MSLYKQLRIRRVWSKARPIAGCDPNVFRRDPYGRVMCRFQYGNRQSSYGWERDHRIPKSRGGGDELANLQPLHWRSNVNKGSRLW